MAEGHHERLVVTQTDDGLILEGAQLTPVEPQPSSTVVVWMHGFTGRFYEPHTLAIGRRLADAGYTFVTGNNRGHDLGAFVQRADARESLLAGAWWEDVQASRYDLSAWIDFGCRVGAARLVLAGHSLGAYKAVTYMGVVQDERVTGLISASGPLRMWQRLVDDPQRLAEAERMVAEGRGADLLPPDGGGRVTSAQTLAWRARFGMDPYGFQRPGDDSPLSRIRCPILFVLGSEEPEIGKQADLPTLECNARSAARVDTAYVEGADHVYTGRETVVADVIAAWIHRLR